MQHPITTNAVSTRCGAWCAFIVALLAALMLTQKPAEAAKPDAKPAVAAPAVRIRSRPQHRLALV